MDPSQPACGPGQLPNEMDEVIKEFLVECNEGLDRFDRDLVALEKDRSSRDLLDSIFRAIHTIKGTGGVLGYEKLVSISHIGESVLSRMRDGLLLLSPAITTALLAMADALRAILQDIASAGTEGDGDYSGVLQQLSAVLEQAQPPAPPKPPPIVSVPQPESAAPPLLGEILVAADTCKPEDVVAAVGLQQEGDTRRLGQILVDARAAHPTAVAEGLKTQNDYREIVSNTIRVDVALLDKVMNLVGELVLARNQVLQFTGTQKDSSFLSTAQRLNLITTELQEGVMKTRMQPIGNVWNKLPRMVRDLSVGCGKQVEIQMEGAETELDKTIIEAIKDPLTHIIRNAVDHGIELPEARACRRQVARRASAAARLPRGWAGQHRDLRRRRRYCNRKTESQGHRQRHRYRRACRAHVGARAAEPGLLAGSLYRRAGQQHLRPRRRHGRGEDQYREDRRHGRSPERRGKGTLLKIKIPLTLAIIPALVVTSGGERFAIPQVSLIELVRSEGQEAGHGIENIHGASVYRLRGNLLPLVYLNRELQLGGESASASINIVVLQAGDRQFGLVVDEINDTEEIVVKPLSKQLKSVSCFAGATIMGDGRVALILDVLGLAQMTRVVSELHEQNVAKQGLKSADSAAQREAWLLFRIGNGGRMAIPLSLVSRLEEFPATQVERFAGHEVIQYREQIMPLVRLAEALGYAGASTASCCRSSCTPATGAASAWWWTRSWTSPISRRRCSRSAR